METELESRHDAEVSAAATDAPVKVPVLIRAGDEHIARCRHHFGRQDVDAREPESPGEVAIAAAQGQTPNAGVRDDSARRSEAVELGFPIDVGEQAAALNPGSPGSAVDPHGAHQPEVDQDASVGHRLARGAMTAASNGNLQVVLPGKLNRRNDIGGPARPGYERGTLVDHPGPGSTGHIVL